MSIEGGDTYEGFITELAAVYGHGFPLQDLQHLEENTTQKVVSNR